MKRMKRATKKSEMMRMRKPRVKKEKERRTWIRKMKRRVRRSKKRNKENNKEKMRWW